MTKRARWSHTPIFKAKVTLAAIKGEKTLSELAQQFDVHPEPDHAMARSASRRRGGSFRTRQDESGGCESAPRLTFYRRPTLIPLKVIYI